MMGCAYWKWERLGFPGFMRKEPVFVFSEGEV